MNATHLEVSSKNGNSNVEAGQFLKIVRETTAFYYVQAFNGTEIKVSKKTKRGCGCERGFWRRNVQPEFNVLLGQVDAIPATT